MNTPSRSRAGKLHAQFRRTHLSQRDFQEAAAYARAYSFDLSEPIRRALKTAAAVAYARPFTLNEKSACSPAVAQVPLNPAALLKKDEHELHVTLLSLRHEALAHSQYSRKPIEEYEVFDSGYVVQGAEFDILNEPLNLEAVGKLCDKWVESCRHKKVELAKIIHDEDAA